MPSLRPWHRAEARRILQCDEIFPGNTLPSFDVAPSWFRNRRARPGAASPEPAGARGERRRSVWASSSPISLWVSWARTASSSPSAARIVPSHSDTAPLSGSSKRAFGARGIGFASLDVRSAEGEKFARALEATTTSEVFLFDRARTLRYRGAIDDQYGIGYSKPAPTKSYLADAIDGLLSSEAIAVEATTAPGCVLSLERAAISESVTYHNRVSRILQRNCETCHRESGPGPFVLGTYEAARDVAPMIALVVENGIMPPWFADPATGHWENDRTLSERDRSALRDWAANGAPAGDPGGCSAAETLRLRLVHRNAGRGRRNSRNRSRCRRKGSWTTSTCT